MDKIMCKDSEDLIGILQGIETHLDPLSKYS
jgi:hypothetical protein